MRTRSKDFAGRAVPERETHSRAPIERGDHAGNLRRTEVTSARRAAPGSRGGGQTSVVPLRNVKLPVNPCHKKAPRHPSSLLVDNGPSTTTSARFRVY